MPPNRFESEVESFLEGSHGDRTHIKRADHPRLHHYAGRYSWRSHRYKIRPTAPPQQHFRDKIRPAPRKWPVFRDFGPAGRVLSRLEVRRWIAGRIFALNNGGRTITPRPVVVVPGKQQAPENSHVIRLKEVSTNAENVAIPARRIQDLKQSQGNYVRNW